MISIRRSEVPLYLRTSSFYLSLNEEDDEPITIASTNFKLDKSINSADDLRNLLNTIQFWGTDSVLGDIVDYCVDSTNATVVVPVLAEFDGELEYLKILPELHKTPKRERVKRCALVGNLPILTYLLGKSEEKLSTTISAAAASSGNLHCLKYLLERSCPVDITALIAASQHNRLECLMHLCNIGIAMNYSVTQVAVSNGHLGILQYIHQQRGPWGRVEFTQEVAKRGHLDCLIYLTENGCPWGHAVCSYAAENGHLDCFQYAHEHGCEWIESDLNQHRSVTTNAASKGHLDCLMYAHQAGCPIGTSACTAAAQRGHLSCLVYSHEQGGIWDATTTQVAASGGHLPCLQYAMDQGCPTTVNITEHAASAPTLDCLTYLVESGFNLTVGTSANAAQNSLAHLTYVHEHNCPWDEETCIKAASCAARDASCLQYAHEQGCPWDARVCAAAALVGNLKALIYAHEHGCPWDKFTGLNAVRSDEVNCLQYACENQCYMAAEEMADLAHLLDADKCMNYLYTYVFREDCYSYEEDGSFY